MDHTTIYFRHAAVWNREGVLCKGIFHSMKPPQAVIAEKQKLLLLDRLQSLESIPEVLFGDLLVGLPDNKQWIFSHDHGALLNLPGGERTPSSSWRGFQVDGGVSRHRYTLIGYKRKSRRIKSD
jgi:hypothetical protein